MTSGGPLPDRQKPIRVPSLEVTKAGARVGDATVLGMVHLSDEGPARAGCGDRLRDEAVEAPEAESVDGQDVDRGEAGLPGVALVRPGPGGDLDG
jgi:hypothetical protein